MLPTLPELLTAFSEILNVHGPDSREAAEFILEHANDEELIELAELSRKLKRALTYPMSNAPCQLR
jgi:hypothetical protein